MLGAFHTDARNVALAQSRAYDRRHLLYSWEGAPFGVSLLDAEGHILQSNEAMRSITGYDAGELARLPVSSYTHPDDVLETVSSFRRLLAGETDSYRLETRLIDKDGCTVWVDCYLTTTQETPGAPWTALGMVQDITSRKLAEANLQREKADLSAARREQAEALARFETIFERAPIGIGLLSLTGRLRSTNSVMRDITGQSAEQLASRNVAEYTFPEDVDGVVRLFTEMLEGKHDSYRHEHRLYTTDGEVVWVDVATALLRDADGKPQGAVTMAQDITQRRAAEEQLRQSQKIDAIGQLAAGIAHDFNNLLVGMVGYTELARAKLGAGDPAAEYLSQVESCAQRATTLTGQLLAFGRRQALHPRPLELNALVSETVAMLRSILGDRIELVAALDPALGIVRADGGQMQQVLLNLALNARDAMPDGGTLTIRTTNAEVGAGGLFSRELEPGPYVVLSIEDEGSGMTPEVLDKIFDPFFTTKDVGKGTGLGLSSAHGILKQSGGHIEVASEPNLGSSFHCYLPAIPAPLAEDEGTTEPEPQRLFSDAPPGAGRRILVVEDEAVVRRLLAHTLAQLGYAVETAEDPSFALPKLRERGDEFALVISDMMMPHMTGADLARKVAEWQPELPFVFISGYTEDLGTGESPFLQKPFTLETLATTVREALEHSDQERRAHFTQ